MKGISHIVAGAAIVAALATPAAAQEPEWIRQLEAHLEQHAEMIARAFEQQVDRQEQQRDAARRRQEAAQRQREARRAAQQARSGPELTEEFSRTVRLGRNGTFDLENIGGDIEVTGGGGDDVKIDATKRARHPDEAQRRALLQAIQIAVMERGGNVEVRTDYPRRRNWYGSVDYKVAVPRNANVTLRSISGDVRVLNVNGELRAETVSGELVTTGARRLRSVRSVSGNIELMDAEGDDVSAGTISGDVVVKKARLRALDLQSVSGDLIFDDVEATRVNARSFNGDIEYRGPLARTGRYEFQTQSGDVRITPINTEGFTVEAMTFSGDVRSDFALTLQGGTTTTTTTTFSPRRMNRAIQGSFGNAGATLSLQSFSGDIIIAR